MEDIGTAIELETGDDLLDHAVREFGVRVDLPTRFIADPAPVKAWTPPPLPFEIMAEHELGGPTDELLPDVSGDAGVRFAAHRIKRLPASLRALLHSVKLSQHRNDLLNFIEDEVRARVDRTAFREVEVPGDFETTWYVPEIHRGAITQGLAADPTFLRELRTMIETTKVNGHLYRLFGHWPRPLPELPACTLPARGCWNAESWLGLSSSSMPEAAPEEVLVALAQRFWRRHRHAGVHPGRERCMGRVLHWGALNSTLAVALIGTAPQGLAVEVDEVDTVGQEQSIPWVGWRWATMPEGTSYDFVVVHVPPPGEGANQVRNRYKGLASPSRDEIHVEDLGRRGPRKWRKGLFKVLDEVLARLKPDAELVLLLPTAVRVAPKVGRFPLWGYEPRAELLDGVVEFLLERGLHLVRDLTVAEQSPLPQAFFQDRRCPWSLVIASHTAIEPECEDDAVERALDTLEGDLG